MRAFPAAMLVTALALAACAPGTTDELLPLNGTELFVHAEGRGEPVVILHGGPLLEHGYLLPHLRPLADEFRLVFADQRLSGRSAPTVDSASVRLATFVEDIEALRRHLGAERIHLLGHSWGGQLALRYALAHGDRLASLVLVSPTPPSSALWQQEEAQLAAFVTAEDSTELAALRAAPGLAAGDTSLIRQMLQVSFRSAFHDRSRASGLTITVPDRYQERSRQFGLLWPELQQYDLVPELARIRTPTLIVFGASEPAFALSGQLLADSLPDAELVGIPDAGHFAFIEQPARFQQAVRAFLSAHAMRR